MTKTIGKILWVVAIIFMGLTAVMNLLGGIGTVCAAFLTENYPSMSQIIDYRWLPVAYDRHRRHWIQQCLGVNQFDP